MAKRRQGQAALLLLLLVHLSLVHAFYGAIKLKVHRLQKWGASFSSTSHKTSRIDTTVIASHHHKFRDFDELLEAHGDEALLVLFTAINCGPCRLQKKEIAVFRQKLSGESQTEKNKGPKVFAIETEKWPQIGARYNIGKLPCLLIIKERQVLSRMEGLTTADALIKQVQAHLPVIHDPTTFVDPTH